MQKPTQKEWQTMYRTLIIILYGTVMMILFNYKLKVNILCIKQIPIGPKTGYSQMKMQSNFMEVTDTSEHKFLLQAHEHKEEI